jgi:hypothetical protein
MLLEAGTRLDPKPGDMSDEVRAVIEAHAAGA